jgi:hypothetical protein
MMAQGMPMVLEAVVMTGEPGFLLHSAPAGMPNICTGRGMNSDGTFY